MTSAEAIAIVLAARERSEIANLMGANLMGANLMDADLGGANMRGAHMRGANLMDADLRDADLGGADLRDADLGGADLRGANLRGANLRGANLRGANLGGAYLRGANLKGAYLGSAYLVGADLRGANLPAPTILLLASWGTVADGLTVELMRFDAACHPDPEAFARWAAGGACPYDGVRVQRAAMFTESRELWSPGPCPRPYDLMTAILAECCPDWTDARRAEFDAKFARKEAP